MVLSRGPLAHHCGHQLGLLRLRDGIEGLQVVRVTLVLGGFTVVLGVAAEWLTVFQLPAHAPDLEPTEGIWALVGPR
jgi:hypothetical protein